MKCKVDLSKSKVMIVPREGIVKILTGLVGMLALTISLFGISSCAAGDGKLQDTFMSYCQFGGRIELDNIKEATDWFPGTRLACRSALLCIEERLPQDQFGWENTFYDLVGEFSDPMTEVVVGCVESGDDLGG